MAKAGVPKDEWGRRTAARSSAPAYTGFAADPAALGVP
jgi:hypothetical protein